MKLLNFLLLDLIVNDEEEEVAVEPTDYEYIEDTDQDWITITEETEND